MAASVQKRGRFGCHGDDTLDEFLLNQVAKFVKYGQLGPLSRDLRISQTDYEKITAPNTFPQNDQIFRVLDKWLQRLPLEYNVRSFMGDVICWHRDGYLDTGVWNHLQRYIEPQLLPQITAPSGEAAGQSSGDGASCILITEKEFEEIQRWNKESLIFRCRNCLSHDWLPDDKARSFSLRVYYVNLDWLKTIKHVMRDERVPMRRIHDVFVSLKPNQPVRILIIGEPGCGKTCSMAMLAMDWAEDRAPCELQQFEFIFLIALKNVSKNVPLEEVILQQHGRMKAMGVSNEQIKSFIQKKKVLILLDGYDEYRKGTNTDIDNAITDTLGSCFLLVTSRPGEYMKKPDREQMDGEVQITGFGAEAIKECSTKYLGNEQKSEDFQYKCWQSGIRELLRIPIVLLMLCVLYYAKETLPKRKTDIVFGIIKMYVNRAKQRFPEVGKFEQLLFNLGKLSWEALQRNTKQLLINKDEVCNAEEDILKLGLLFGSLEGDEASVDEQPEWLSYPHRLFQDFVAGFYVSKTKELLQSLFLSWDDINYMHHEVVLFAVGLMSDPTPLVDHVYQMMINDKLEQMRNKKYYSSLRYDNDLLKSLYIESKVQLPGHPLHNQHINYYDHLDDDILNRPRDTTTIYFPSKLYEFSCVENGIALGTENRKQESEVPECALIISFDTHDEAVRQSLLSNCQVIMRNQAVNNLFVENVKSTDLPQKFAFDISRHIQSLTLKQCTFPSRTLKHLMEQIKECSMLRKIELQYTNLGDVSSMTLSKEASLTYLDLSWTHMSRELSQSVCHQLIDLTQLKHLNLSGIDLSHLNMLDLSNKPKLSHLNCHETQMSTNLSKNVMGQLRYITHLSKLNLSRNTLTGCLSRFLSDSHHGLPELSFLRLDNTALNKDDLQHLSNITQSNKLPKLRVLNLSQNILTGCLSRFLPDQHPALPELKDLNLGYTKLNKDDIHHLSTIMFNNKIPNLLKMELRGNTLTGYLSSFLQDPHPGLPELNNLGLNYTALNKEDLTHLTHLLKTHKLPRLNFLHLDANRLCETETDVEHLIEACVDHHKRTLWLMMRQNDLPVAFRKKLKQRCAGTSIILMF